MFILKMSRKIPVEELFFTTRKSGYSFVVLSNHLLCLKYKQMSGKMYHAGIFGFESLFKNIM